MVTMRLTRLTGAAAAVLLAVGVLAEPAAGTGRTAPQDTTSRWIVTLHAGDPDVVAADHRRRLGTGVDHVYRHALRGYSATMTAQQARQVASDPNVAAMVPDTPVHTTAQSVPAGISRTGGDRSSARSGDGRGSVDADIAIIDTGIDPKHPDLDVVGGTNCISGGLSSADLNGHGTHVAGTAAAKDNGVGVVGVAPGARLWAVRVLDANGSGLFSSIICGIDWVTARASTIEVANMSLGGVAPEGSCTDGALHQAICRSVAAGVTYAVAAGNSASDAATFVPASFDEVITVSATADFDGLPGGLGAPTCALGVDDVFASFSNYGPDVDLTAPGVCVLSTFRGRDYRALSGTSMASPHVAGAAALYRSSHPSATPAQVKAALLAAGTRDWTGDPDQIQEPMVNVSVF